METITKAPLKEVMLRYIYYRKNDLLLRKLCKTKDSNLKIINCTNYKFNPFYYYWDYIIWQL